STRSFPAIRSWRRCCAGSQASGGRQAEMIIGLALVVGLMIAWALGAKLSNLAELQFRGDVLVFASLAVQLAVFTPLRDRVPDAYVVPLHLLSYALIVGFFALNVRVPGFWLVGFGVISNLFVIAANGGRMPV